MSDGAIYKDLSLKEDLREISIKNQGNKPVVLPESVRHLPDETGISGTGICKLLGIANKEGHKLADVVAFAKPYLAKTEASAGRVYRYLLAMLLNPKKIDYTSKLAQMARQDEGITRAKSMKEMAAQCRYKRYKHASVAGLTVRFYDGVAEVSRDGMSETLAGVQLEVLYRDVAAGKLQEIMD